MSQLKAIIVFVLLSLTGVNHQVGASGQFNAAKSQELSRNWAGYTSTGGTYTGVSATWTAPIVKNSGNFGTDATWVGIGGVTKKDLIQAGTQIFVDPRGEVYYQAFYETLPEASTPLDLSIHGGDTVTISLNKTTSNIWLISIINNTTGESSKISIPYNSSLSSADWIEEAPSSPRRILPLDDFGTITFKNAYAIVDGKSQTLNALNPVSITMADYKGSLATPSLIEGEEASFSVARTKTPSISYRIRYY